MANSRQSKFEKWVPSAACQMIDALRGSTHEHHAILDRLSNEPIMRTDVWGKLSEATGREAEVVYWTFVYALRAYSFVEPPPIKKGEYPQWAKENNALARHTLNHVAPLADRCSRRRNTRLTTAPQRCHRRLQACPRGGRGRRMNSRRHIDEGGPTISSLLAERSTGTALGIR
jgi:hypothetical protein